MRTDASTSKLKGETKKVDEQNTPSCSQELEQEKRHKWLPEEEEDLNSKGETKKVDEQNTPSCSRELEQEKRHKWLPKEEEAIKTIFAEDIKTDALR